MPQQLREASAAHDLGGAVGVGVRARRDGRIALARLEQIAPFPYEAVARLAAPPPHQQGTFSTRVGKHEGFLQRACRETGVPRANVHRAFHLMERRLCIAEGVMLELQDLWCDGMLPADWDKSTHASDDARDESREVHERFLRDFSLVPPQVPLLEYHPGARAPPTQS